jgi:hypothetical protein
MIEKRRRLIYGMAQSAGLILHNKPGFERIVRHDIRLYLIAHMTNDKNDLFKIGRLEHVKDMTEDWLARDIHERFWNTKGVGLQPGPQSRNWNNELHKTPQ